MRTVFGAIFLDIQKPTEISVLKVLLKGGLSGRVEAWVVDLKGRPGAVNWCYDYVQQTLGNTEYEYMEYGSVTKLDVTDYKISGELLAYAQAQISSNHLSGAVSREVVIGVTGDKRVYKLIWNSKNKFGDKGSISIVKLNVAGCLQTLAS